MSVAPLILLNNKEEKVDRGYMSSPDDWKYNPKTQTSDFIVGLGERMSSSPTTMSSVRSWGGDVDGDDDEGTD